MRLIKETLADMWPVLVLGCIVVVGHYLTRDVEEHELQQDKPKVELIQKDTTKPERNYVGDGYKGDIKHMRDSQGRLRCFYSYVDKYGHHKRIFVLGCHKHKNQ